MIDIRLATANDMQWVNERYDEVSFVHSSLDNEHIAIATYNDSPAGIGRLVTLDEDNAELGGIYVFEAYRGKGIAAAIVKYLLDCSTSFNNIYLLPFAPLASFYKKFGFSECNGEESIPSKIKSKHQWCNQNYSAHKTLLYCLTREKDL